MVFAESIRIPTGLLTRNLEQSSSGSPHRRHDGSYLFPIRDAARDWKIVCSHMIGRSRCRETDRSGTNTLLGNIAHPTKFVRRRAFSKRTLTHDVRPYR